MNMLPAEGSRSAAYGISDDRVCLHGITCLTDDDEYIRRASRNSDALYRVFDAVILPILQALFTRQFLQIGLYFVYFVCHNIFKMTQVFQYFIF